MRVVLDTNVVLSAMLWRGTPSRLLDCAVEGDVLFYTSRTLLDELDEVLHRPHLRKAIVATGFTAAQLVQRYQRLAHLVTARQLTTQICRDADDDVVLACALAAHADLIVSGDNDLLVLHPFQHIPIVNAAEALRRLTRHS